MTDAMTQNLIADIVNQVMLNDHHHRGCCLLVSNRAEEISEAAMGLLFVPGEYQLNYDLNFIKNVIITLLTLSISKKGIIAILGVSWILLKKGLNNAYTPSVRKDVI